MTSDYEEGSDAKEVKSEQKDLDMVKIQASMQGLREQKEQEFQEDLDEINNQQKPPYMDVQTSSGVNEGVHWEDRGIINVPVVDLPRPDGINRPQDFNHHISYPDTVRAMDELQQMRPPIEKGYTGDDFALADRANGVDYVNGQQRVYDLFYGNDAIKLDKDGNHYDIVNGRHRIFVAKEKGYDFIPARVTEKVEGHRDS